MPTLYDILGVRADASADEIRAAYRRAARDAHPDRAGGSTERMQSVNRANEILSDPDRRATYDATGDTAEKPSVVDKAEAMLAEYLALAIDSAPAGKVLEHVAMLIDKVRTVCQLERAKAEAESARLLKRRDKIHTAPGVRNIAHDIIDDKAARLARVVQVSSDTLLVVEAALPMLEAYSTSEDPPPPPAYQRDSIFGREWLVP